MKTADGDVTPRTYFLRDLAPDVYDCAGILKVPVLVYSAVLASCLIISRMLHIGDVSMLIDVMTGWTALSILFVFAVLVLIDRQVVPRLRKLVPDCRLVSASIAWSVSLCLFGIAALSLTDACLAHQAAPRPHLTATCYTADTRQPVWSHDATASIIKSCHDGAQKRHV